MPTSSSGAKRSASLQDAIREGILRTGRESTAEGLQSDAAPEPTLDEARADLARAVSGIAQKVLADRFGPLTGTITETTVIAGLKNFEEQVDRAKGDFNLVAHELADRFVSSISKTKKK
jgi:hypothetical protein